MSTTPHIKFEHSPADSLADSFDSTPGTSYPSLFENNSMDPIDIMTPAMTPRSFEDDSMFGGSIRGDSVLGDTPAPEKKPVKKRKSWGQQLPEPKTNLPPRKRAKTEDEKEQRRVERVLRNRRAAQSSRERKRQEVEALEAEKRAIERRNQDLEMRLAHAEAQNIRLQQELEQITGKQITAFQSPVSSPAQELRQAPSPVTFSQELFGSRDSTKNTSISTQALSEVSPQTVNPASISPEIRPVSDSANASSSDMTQHPAAMLCDLQCQSEEQRPWMNSTTATNSAIYQIWIATTLLSLISGATSTLLNPLNQIVNSLNTGSSLSPTTSILTLIIWLVTTTAPLTISTSTTSSTTMTSLRPRLSLRIRLLRRLLACSPRLARPLMDATMSAMRSASEQQLSNACLLDVDASDRDQRNSPSVCSLMTLLWTIHVIERERTQKTTKLDAATEVRQACDKLGELFSTQEIETRFSSPSTTSTTTITSGALYGDKAKEEKSFEGWRTGV
ncbi:hypothetical protein HYALB_00005810 [Hymenoscyphus albidus]|uniref:BZIP domain-containing protein n=1 Tax=Hymenoscyphus albidus TaxID=595503 RepID=A0A9N9LIU4_9HELO|nr:hypothetical protein HYALB_00005810 [Hymenoscyphus albidus]